MFIYLVAIFRVGLHFVGIVEFIFVDTFFVCLCDVLENAADNLKGRTVWASLGDLKADGEASRKFRLRVEYVHGTNCLTQFYGMELSRDKLCSLVKKYQSLIEAFVDIRTSDDYTLRLFCIGFTNKRENQNPFRKTAYAQAAQVSNRCLHSDPSVEAVLLAIFS